jgi:hypothetical protein
LKKTINNSRVYLFILIILAIAVILSLANYQYSSTSPGGNDFLVHWVGARNFITQGLSPYSDQTALDIQTIAYGRPAVAGEHELRVAYPLYSMIVFAPFALIAKFSIARALWMTVLEFSLVGVILLSIGLIFWKPKFWMLFSFVIFGLFFYHGIRPLINGNIVILITLFSLLLFRAIRDGNDEIAGVLLALITIKPQNTLLLILFILFWAISTKRTKIITWFAGTMVILIGFSMLLIPDWIIQNIREIVRYTSYNPPGSIGAALVAWWGTIGSRIGAAIAILLGLLLIFEWWRSRKSKFRHFLWTACLTVTISQMIGIQTDPGNFVILYPALFLGFTLLWERWKERSYSTILPIITFLFIFIWVLFLFTVGKESQPLQNPIMFFPFPIIVFGLLYWSRWWVLRSKQIDIENKFISP